VGVADLAAYQSNVKRRRRRAADATGLTFAQAFSVYAAHDLEVLRNWFELNTGPRLELDLANPIIGTVDITSQAEADALVGKMVRGIIRINAADIELRDFGVEWDHSGTGATLLQSLNGVNGAHIHHFLIDGHMGNISYGISGTTYSENWLVEYGEIRQIGGDAVRLFKNSTYRNLYIHSFRPGNTARDGVFDDEGSQSLFPHTDALQIMRSGNVVEECWVENTDGINATGAVTLIPDADEAVTSFEMRDCYVDGGANVFYIDNQNADIDNPGANGQPTGLVFEDLLIGRKHRADVWRHREVPSTSFTKTNVLYADTRLPVEAYFLDDFNRANENLEASANYNRMSGVAGGLAIDTNKLKSITTTQSTYLVALAQGIDLVNHFVETDWHRNISSTGWLLARYQDESNYVGMQILALKPALYTRIGGTFSQVSAPADVVVGDNIRIECDEQTIRLYHKGVLVVTRTLAAGILTSGRVGIQARTTIANPLLDNFSAGTLKV
jgi:hypothetical protein